MTPLPLLFVLASVDAPAPPPSTATVAEPAAEPEAEAEPEDEYSEAGQIKKRGIPARPATVKDRKAYLKWRHGLSRKVQVKLDRYCREEGGNYRAVCDGIGPHSIPSPPRAAVPAQRKKWYLGLTTQQQRYVDEYCSVVDEYGDWKNGYSDLCGGTPIVLAFDSERVQYTSGPMFDWPTATTPWLALDHNGDGSITPDELFGAQGPGVPNGFVALRALDANGDHLLDARDPAFALLLVWADRDGSRTSSLDELSPLTARVTSLSLVDSREDICDARGNCEGERASFSWRADDGTEHTGTAIDVYLRIRD